MKKQDKQLDGSHSRRQFIQTSAIAGAGMVLGGTMKAFADESTNAENHTSMIDITKNIKTRGYAATDESGQLSPYEFERRPVGDDDILIDVKFASICHSDIHQEKGHWGKQQYPQVPGHEIVGVVTAVGRNVTKFKVGDRAGVGCMVDSCMECNSCKAGEEHFCDRGETVFTYGYPLESEPTGISQGGYSNKIVVRDHFAVHIPEHISFQEAAPLLCAGITTYSPLMDAQLKVGEKVGVAGIGGLGHMAVKLAVSKGAEVYAFTTSPDKVDDIKSWGAKEVIVVDEAFKNMQAYAKTLDYMICTIPYEFNITPYIFCLKPGGTFTFVGMPIKSEITINNLMLAFARVNFNASLIGGIPETQEVVHYCADNGIKPEIQVIKAENINEAWEKVVNKEARYRYVIDAATF
ncbi:alcohol dehydrogenase catalytic domain-containing protein [Mangrovimonas spongiae]|uniref:Twin-arginine translocation signal domain-containing protein n=1 Tax=Mangrovimonas spongiae TaxID=2494697 RepID=A0A3R9MF95_9FLAO|nr:alcohol dehydrogenase catalytic domain-containing protein [Mangrovimonas spongiae]RSK39056.1 twin-arginine translocation signal domain-containing protein [Mangrovimonas spongiae]